VQLHEVLTRPPTRKEFGYSKFDWLAPVLHSDIDAAWQMYSQIIEHAVENGHAGGTTQGVASKTSEHTSMPIAPATSVHQPMAGPQEPAAKKRSWLDRLLRR
jgi:hypothetical protein